MKRRILKLTVALAIVVGAFTLFKDNRTFIDYAGFLSVYADEIEQPLLEIAVQEEVLDQAVVDETITREQYDQAIVVLEEQKDAIEERKVELMEEYQIEEDMNLEEVVFSTDDSEDQRLKEIFTTQNELLETQQAKEEAQQQLEADYQASKITVAEYVASKQNDFDDAKEIAKLEDRSEQIAKSSYFSALTPEEKQQIQEIYKSKLEVDKKYKKAAIQEKKLLQEYAKDKITYQEYLAKVNDVNQTRKELAVLDGSLAEQENKVISTANLENVKNNVVEDENDAAADDDVKEVMKAANTDGSKIAKENAHNETTTREVTTKVTALKTNPAQAKSVPAKKNTTKRNK